MEKEYFYLFKAIEEKKRTWDSTVKGNVRESLRQISPYAWVKSSEVCGREKPAIENTRRNP